MVALERTPLDDAAGMLWIDPVSWDLRLSDQARSKIVFGDLATGSVLWHDGSRYRIGCADEPASIAFRLDRGLATDVSEVPNSPWWTPLLQLVPEPGEAYAGAWSRIGIRDGSASCDISLPADTYPGAADRLRDLGLTVIRIRRLPAVAAR